MAAGDDFPLTGGGEFDFICLIQFRFNWVFSLINVVLIWFALDLNYRLFGFNLHLFPGF